MSREVADFLDKSEVVLRKIMSDGEELLPEELIDEFRAAWQEMPDQFNTVRHELHHVDPRELEQAGLSGRQMQLKMAGFRQAYQMVQNGLGLRWIKKALRWMNVILGSLASVIAGAEIIKEFKESVEIGIDNAEEETEDAGW